MTIITRFAPSPTGPLHLGGARTALFNYLYAKKNKGKFKLRIEDTDKDRNTNESTDSIIKSLDWLGLKIDDDIIYQSNNLKEHVLVAESLLSNGLAYKCFHDKEYLQQFKSSKEKFHSEWRNKQDNLPKNKDYCVRIKSPANNNHILNDKIQGKVQVNGNEMDDYIIIRSDGSPTFLLSSAIDDYNMKITDIIRGDDHLTNSFRQKIIFDFLNYKPNFSHISLIHNENNQKMSKRDNSISILDYKKKGYLPEAIINYLIRLGWSQGDKEIFSMEFLKDNFDLDRLGKSPARFDEKKLNYLNNYYIKLMQSDEILFYLKDNYNSLINIELFNQNELYQLIDLFKDRASSLEDIISNISKLGLIKKDFNAEEKVILKNFEKYKKTLVDKLSDIIEWNEQNIEIIIKDVIEYHKTNFKSIAQPLRLLITGSLFGPSIYKIIMILGNKKIIQRINR